MLLSSFFIVDIDKIEVLPDVTLPENVFLCFRVTSGNRSHIDHFIQKEFVLQGKTPFCIMIDLHGDAFKTDDELQKMTEGLVSLSFHYKYLKLDRDNPLIIFDSPVEKIDNYAAILKDRFIEQGYGDIETVVINSATNHLCFQVQQNIDALFSSYLDLISKITSAGNAVYFFLDHPEILQDVLNTLNKVEIQFKKENSQVWHLLNENIALIKKERESHYRATILEEKLESLKNYQNPSDSRYKRQITELLYFYKHEYEILPLWYKRFGHIIKVLRGQRTFMSLFKDNVKKYKN